MNELKNPRLSRYFDGVAWHLYMGSVTEVSRVHDVFPNKICAGPKGTLRPPSR
jgi:hypothetical protein